MKSKEAFPSYEAPSVEVRHGEVVTSLTRRVALAATDVLDNLSSYAIGASLGFWGAYFADAYFAAEVVTQAAEKIGISLDTPLVGPLVKKTIVALMSLSHVGSLKLAPYLLTAAVVTKAFAKLMRWYLKP